MQVLSTLLKHVSALSHLLYDQRKRVVVAWQNTDIASSSSAIGHTVETVGTLTSSGSMLKACEFCKAPESSGPGLQSPGKVSLAPLEALLRSNL